MSRRLVSAFVQSLKITGMTEHSHAKVQGPALRERFWGPYDTKHAFQGITCTASMVHCLSPTCWVSMAPGLQKPYKQCNEMCGYLNAAKYRVALSPSFANMQYINIACDNISESSQRLDAPFRLLRGTAMSPSAATFYALLSLLPVCRLPAITSVTEQLSLLYMQHCKASNDQMEYDQEGLGIPLSYAPDTLQPDLGSRLR